MREQGRTSGRGCLFYTGIALGLSIVVLLIASFLGYRYARKQIDQFTDTKATVFPSLAVTGDELEAARQRTAGFCQAVEQGQSADPLTLSDDELNALIASHPDLVTVRGSLRFDFQGSNVLAEFSVPAEDLGLKPLQGRYVNAAGQFRVGMTNGLLNVNAETLSARGEPLPKTFMDRIRPQNFAYKLSHDPRASNILKRIEDVRVQDGQLIMVPRQSQ
jgi:hypothetical protein